MFTEFKLAYDSIDEVKELFSEYTKSLIAEDESMKDLLSEQNYEDEINNLEEKYGLPCGRLYLAYLGDHLAGCVALRKIDEDNCEMKRLYVRPEFRSQNVGKDLVEKIIEDAKEIGYSYIYLDTLTFLDRAISMYREFGFYETINYNDTKNSSSIFMKRKV